MPAAPFVQALVHLLRNESSRDRFTLLQPICDQIERRQHKQAIAQCTKLLKKHPTLYVAHALKAWCLYRSGRAKEAADVFEALDKDPFNAYGEVGYVRIIAYTLFRLGRTEDVDRMYSICLKKVPTDISFTADAFLIFGEVGNVKAQQQMALKLAKPTSVTDGDLFLLFWALTSFIAVLSPAHPTHLASTSPTASPVAQSLDHDPLQVSFTLRVLQTIFGPTTTGAEPATTRLKKAKFFEDANECWAVARALQLIGCFSGAGKIIGSPAGLNLSAAIADGEERATGVRAVEGLNETAKLARMDLLTLLETEEGRSWRAKNLGLEILWREAVRDWGDETALRALIGSMTSSLETGDTNWHTMLTLVQAVLALPSPSDSIAEIDALFRDLDEKSLGKERGYLLARLELTSILRSTQRAPPVPIVELVSRYAHIFGSKSCCFSDLRRFVTALSVEERAEVLAALPSMDDVSKMSEDDKTEKTAVKAATFEALRRSLAPSSKEGSSTVAHVLALYDTFLPLGADWPSTDLQVADDFGILAAQVLISESAVDSPAPMVLAAVVLQQVVDKSPYRYQARTLLVRLYRLLGAQSLALAAYQGLDAKQTQHDTVSHFALDRASAVLAAPMDFGGGQAAAAFDGPMEFYQRTTEEARDWISRAYMGHNYPKVVDFSAFRDRLSRSLAGRILTLEGLRLKTVVGRSLLGPGWTAEREVLAEMVAADREAAWLDNRDFSIMPDHQPVDGPRLVDQTAAGPLPSAPWLRAMSIVYARALLSLPASEVKVPASGSEEEKEMLESLTENESALYGVSSAFAVADSDRVKAFFTERMARLHKIESGTVRVLPWEVFETASVMVEAYALLDVSVERTLSTLSSKAKKDEPMRNRLAARAAANTTLAMIPPRLRGAFARAAEAELPPSFGVGSASLSPNRVAELADRVRKSQEVAVNGMVALVEARCKPSR